MNSFTGKRRVSLIDLTDKHMTRHKIGLSRGVHYYPSEASVVIKGADGNPKVEGGCLRRSYLRAVGGYEQSKPSPYNEWIFELGRAVEAILTEQYKQMGLWVGNSIRWMNEEYNLSGEIDIVIRDPENREKMVCCENKSFYGYYAGKEICGSRGQEGKPKTSHLMQLLIYLNECKGMFEYGKLIYYARDSADRAEFNVELFEEKPGFTYPVVNNKIDRRFTIEDIYRRYKELDDYVQKKIVPPNDFELYYSDEKIQRLYQLGEVSKTAYEKYTKKGEKVGDWNCSYCGFCKTTCWKQNGNPRI